MPDPNQPLSETDARQLLRRGGFGFRKRDVDKILRREETPAEAVARFLKPRGSRFKPGGSYIGLCHDKWVKYMLRTQRQFQEKMVVFLHDHFATSNDTVDDPKQMALQNQLFRRNFKESFKDLVKAVNKDAAMMDFLDTVRNSKFQPNENYGRELLELFTLGVTDLAGQPNYEQADIVQIARAFTGWRTDDKNKPYLRDNRHDYMADYASRGPKVIFKNHGGFPDQGMETGGRDFTINGEGEPEIDTVIDIIFEHTDSEGHNTVARHLTYKLLEYYTYVDPDLGNRKAVIDEIIASSQFTTTWNLGDLLAAIFVHDVFYETAAPAPFDANTRKSVKWPIDYVVGTMRTLNMRLKGRDAFVSGGEYDFVRDQLEGMGQVLFAPPSVFGWDWETAWISSGALLARYSLARDLTSARKPPYGDAHARRAFRPEKLIDTSRTNAAPAVVVDDALKTLGVADQFTTAERNILIEYLQEGDPQATLDLTDDWTLNTKVNGLFALVLQSPAFQMH